MDGWSNCRFIFTDNICCNAQCVSPVYSIQQKRKIVKDCQLFTTGGRPNSIVLLNV